MALSEERIRFCFEMLETPYSLNYSAISGVGTLEQTTNVSLAAQGQAKTMILTRITAFDADTQTIVEGICDEWKKVRFNFTEIENGGMTDLTGVNYSIEQKKNGLKKLLQTYLPCFRQHEIEEKQMGSSNVVWGSR